MSKKLILVAGAAFLMSGCATLLSEDTQTINVMTNNGAKVKIMVDGVEHTVPGPVTVERNGEDKVIMVKDSKCVSEIALNREIESTFWVNIISGGVFGSTTDSATGKMWTYDDSVTVSCRD